MGLTTFRPSAWARLLALALILVLAPTISRAEGPGSIDVPQDPLLQRPQPIPDSPVLRTLPSEPLHATMPTPSYIAPPPPLVPPAMIPEALLPPGVPRGSTLPVPMPSVR
jgi:hypothetical protein